MKRTTILFVLLFAVSGVFAQKGKVTAALSYKEAGDIEKAVRAIDETVDPNNPKAEGSISWPNAWEARGEIYYAVYSSKDENVKKLSNDPLTVALESYLKALQLDEKNKNAKGIKVKLTLLVAALQGQAVDAFNAENFPKAMKSFEQMIEIEKTPAYKADDPNAIDTAAIFNAGLAAYRAKLWDKAIQYYSEAAKYKYGGADTYKAIADTYFQQNDSVKALNSLQEGLKEFSGDGGLLVEVINYYLNANKADEAMKYLNIALDKDPKNSTYHFAKGTLYEKIQNTAEAIKCYEKAIEHNDAYFEAYYNLAALYFNVGVKQVDVANAVPSNQPAKYEEEKNKADIEFKKSIPFFEKALAVNPTDRGTLESLKTVYYRLQMMDKYAEVVEKIKNVQ